MTTQTTERSADVLFMQQQPNTEQEMATEQTATERSADELSFADNFPIIAATVGLGIIVALLVVAMFRTDRSHALGEKSSAGEDDEHKRKGGSISSKKPVIAQTTTTTNDDDDDDESLDDFFASESLSPALAKQLPIGPGQLPIPIGPGKLDEPTPLTKVDEKSVFKVAEAMLTQCEVIYSFVGMRVLARRTNNEVVSKDLAVPQISSTLMPAMVRHIQILQYTQSDEMATKFAEQAIKVINPAETTTRRLPNDDRSKSTSDGGEVAASSEVFFVADSEENLANSSVWLASINRSSKRITIIFRGTEKNENEDGKNHWSTNLDTTKRWEENPIEELAESAPFFTIHNGFSRALAFSRKSIFYQIQKIKDTYPETRNYQLCIAGHSLGGALAVVFAYHAAQEPSLTKHAPIHVYTFSAPSVAGDENFIDVMSHFMKQDKLRVVRFLDASDVVPQHFGENFKHVGIEIKLQESGYEVKGKGVSEKMNTMLKAVMNPKRALKGHSCSTTTGHLDKFESDFSQMTLEEMYQKHIETIHA